MKNIIVIFILVSMSFSIAFAGSEPTTPQVNDNSGSIKEATGTFGATILTPLEITCLGDVELGEFVKSTIPYESDNADFEGGYLEFLITGEPGHVFYVTVTPSLTNNVADIKIRTNLAIESGTNLIDFDGSGIFGVVGQIQFSDILGGDEGDGIGTYLFGLECYEVLAKNPGEGLFVQTVTVSYNF